MSKAEGRPPHPISSEPMAAFARAAASIRGPDPIDPASARVLALFGFDEAASDAALSAACLLDVAARFTRFFELGASDGPGLVAFGGQIDPVAIAPWWSDGPASVSGVGTTKRQAFENCVGEAAEFLSGFETPSGHRRTIRRAMDAAGMDSTVRRSLEPLFVSSGLPESIEIDWVVANRLSDGMEVLLPADLCLRRAPDRRAIQAPSPLSIGCAAAPTLEGAVSRGLLELIERDAAALWWRGGHRGRLLPLEHAALRDATLAALKVRGGVSRRRGWLLDITADLGIPCVAAVSFRADGRGFCVGTAARPGHGEAAEAALREMFQMELAHEVVSAKRRERGEDALNPGDRRHVRRFTEIDQETCDLVHPLPPRPISFPDFTGGGLRAIVERLVSHGLQPCAMNLTVPEIGIPVARVVCPGLEQEPSDMVGERMRRAIRATGGGERYSHGVQLM